MKATRSSLGTDHLETVRRAELRLLEPEVRADAKDLAILLHPEFHEIGASGRRWTRAEVIQEFAQYEPVSDNPNVVVQDMSVQSVSGGVVLVTYRTIEPERSVLRSSLWVRDSKPSEGESWQIIFHQGTPSPS